MAAMRVTASFALCGQRGRLLGAHTGFVGSQDRSWCPLHVRDSENRPTVRAKSSTARTQFMSDTKIFLKVSEVSLRNSWR